MEQCNELKKCCRLPVGRTVCGMVVGLVISWWAVGFAEDVRCQLLTMLEGCNASVMFHVARNAIWMAAGLAGLLALGGKLCQSRTDPEQRGHILAIMKLAAAVFLSMELSGALGFCAEKYIPCFNVAVPILKGLRGFQLLDIGALLCLIPLMMLLEDRLLDKFDVARHWQRWMLFFSFIAGLWAGVRIISYRAWCEELSGQSYELEHEEAMPEEPRSFRLTEDEPGTVYG